jgi:hypothetical protein
MESAVLKRFDFGVFAAGLSRKRAGAYNEHMSTQPTATHIPEFEIVDPIVAEILRRKTPAERLAISSSMRSSVTKTLQAYLKSQHPAWTSEQIQAEIARRMPRGDS